MPTGWCNKNGLWMNLENILNSSFCLNASTEAWQRLLRYSHRIDNFQIWSLNIKCFNTAFGYVFFSLYLLKNV